MKVIIPLLISVLFISCSTVNPVSQNIQNDNQTTASLAKSSNPIPKGTYQKQSNFATLDYDKSSGKIFVRAYHRVYNKATGTEFPSLNHGHIYTYKIIGGKTSKSDAEKMAKNYDPRGSQKQKGMDGKWITQLVNLHVAIGATDDAGVATCFRFYESRSEDEPYECAVASSSVIKKYLRRYFSKDAIEAIIVAVMRIKGMFPVGVMPISFYCFFQYCESNQAY